MEIRIENGHSTDGRFMVAGSYSCRGPNLFLGYAARPDLTAEVVTDDGFYCPGDLIGRDRDGYLTWLGRTKDVIRRGGLQIDPLELENILSTHPAIGEVIVVAVPDDRLGERAAIVAVPSSSESAPTLEELCDFLSAAGTPRQSLPEFLYCWDALIRTELGKLDRMKIKTKLSEATA
jgi:non-ribosomal peptide synthetase component E (peptide arylation enzyme)